MNQTSVLCLCIFVCLFVYLRTLNIGLARAYPVSSNRADRLLGFTYNYSIWQTFGLVILILLAMTSSFPSSGETTGLLVNLNGETTCLLNA